MRTGQKALLGPKKKGTKSPSRIVIVCLVCYTLIRGLHSSLRAKITLGDKNEKVVKLLQFSFGCLMRALSGPRELK